MLIKRHFYPLRNQDDPAGGGSAPVVPPKPAAPAPAAPVPVVPPPPEQKTNFSLEYVQELRAENAKYRTTAKEAKDAADAAATKAQEAETAATARITAAEVKANERIIRAELKAEAIKAGMVDLDGLKLADLTTVKLDDKGEVVGAAEMMKALKESKPYLFGQTSTTTQTNTSVPKKEEPKPFNARTATDEERAAKAKELGLTLKKR